MKNTHNFDTQFTQIIATFFDHCKGNRSRVKFSRRWLY